MTCYKRRRHQVQLGLLFLFTPSVVAFHTITSKPKPILSIRGASSSAESTSADIQGKRRVVIIGAGVGGLASAARIAAETRKWEGGEVEVVVVEKNGRDMIGGRCGSFTVEVDGVGSFRHERGPSLLLLKDEYESLFADCASNIGTLDLPSAAEKYGLFMKQCIPAYQVVFNDGDKVDLGFPRSKCVGATLSIDEVRKIQEQEQKSIQQLNSIEENGFLKWQGYLDTCAAFLDCGLPNFIEEKLDLSTLPKFLIESLKDNASRWPLQPHSTMLSNLFSSPKMIALASFQDLYVGLEPYVNDKQIGGGVLRKTSPAVFGLLAALELHPTNPKCGVFAPIGGFREVAESMYRLCQDCGVKFEFDASVTRVDRNGVYLKSTDENTKFLSADLIICNADLPYSTQTMLSDGNEKQHHQSTIERYDWDDKFDYSTGVIAFHWSVSKEMVALNTHNVFMSAKSADDAKNSWSVLRGGIEEQMTNVFSADQPFNFYVQRASKTDPTAAPPGCDPIMVLVPCAPLKRDIKLASLPRDEAVSLYKQQFDDEVVSSVREAVFERFRVVEGLEDFRRYIVDEVIDTPGVYSDYYNLGAGVPFGLSHGLGQLSLTRPSVECASYDNVLYVGASTKPGNGVPLVMIGAKAVAKMAAQRLKTKIVAGLQ